MREGMGVGRLWGLERISMSSTIYIYVAKSTSTLNNEQHLHNIFIVL